MKVGQKVKGMPAGLVCLYFYPKDDTSGCTAQACSLRDGFSELQKAGISVIGVSPDSKESHAKFTSKYSLPFMLTADTDKKLAKEFGVWVKKQFYGREYMGIKRTTFLIRNGVVAAIIDKPDVANHAHEVLEKFKLLE